MQHFDKFIKFISDSWVYLFLYVVVNIVSPDSEQVKILSEENFQFCLSVFLVKMIELQTHSHKWTDSCDNITVNINLGLNKKTAVIW